MRRRRAAALTARIFQGAKPADLPFEIPVRYLFVINLSAARMPATAAPVRRATRCRTGATFRAASSGGVALRRGASRPE
jgi:hypothetical protein